MRPSKKTTGNTSLTLTKKLLFLEKGAVTSRDFLISGATAPLLYQNLNRGRICLFVPQMQMGRAGRSEYPRCGRSDRIRKISEDAHKSWYSS